MNIFCWKTTKSTLSNIANFGLFATYLGEEPPLPFVIYPHDPGTATDAEVCTGVSDSNLWFPPIFFSSSSIGIEIEHDLRDGWWCTELCVHPGEQNITMIPTHGHRLTQGSLATPIVTEWGCSSPRLTPLVGVTLCLDSSGGCHPMYVLPIRSHIVCVPRLITLIFGTHTVCPLLMSINS